MNDQSQMMSRNYGVSWSSLAPDDPMKFQAMPMPMNHPRQGFMAAAAKRSGWKGKKPKKGGGGGGGVNIAAGGGVGNIAGGGYKPPTLNELQSQNRVKARRFYPKKKFNNNHNPNNPNRFAPYAPRNTTSFIIRAKKSGGIASLVSPCPVTPAVLPTPIFSPSREVLVDMAKEEWGVDGYGSMNGLIRLRSSPGRDEEDEEDGGGSSESDVEEHVEVERRLDHDLSRFEMIYPNGDGNQMDDQDAHIAQLEEENLTLKERLFLMEREMVDLRMRLQYLETQSRAANKENHDGTLETLENEDSSNKEDNIDNENENENENDEASGKENDEMMDRDEHMAIGNVGEEEDDQVSENEGAGDVCSEKSACVR